MIGSLDEAAVRAALSEVPDPEIPIVSVVDLGMIEAVDVNARRIRVELLPTFIGCPAVDMIRDSVATRLESFGRPVEVDVSFRVPWTSDRITRAGREKLRRSGFAPPSHVGAGRALPVLGFGGGTAAPVECPYCGSSNTALENVFGPTQCRSIRHCADCRQPFEAFKPI